MRHVTRFGFLAALLLVLAPSLGAQDVTGTWELTSTTPRGERTMTVTLDQEGTNITGTAIMQMMGRGGAGGGSREFEISDGTFEDGTLTFTITMGMGERSFSQTYTATTVTADTMEGTIAGGMRNTEPIPFKGVKKEG